MLCGEQPCVVHGWGAELDQWERSWALLPDLLRTPMNPQSRSLYGLSASSRHRPASFFTHCVTKWQIPLRTLLFKPEEHLGWLSLPFESSAHAVQPIQCLRWMSPEAKPCSWSSHCWTDHLTSVYFAQKATTTLWQHCLQEWSLSSSQGQGWRSEVQSCPRDHCVGSAPSQEELGATAKDHFREHGRRGQMSIAEMPYETWGLDQSLTAIWIFQTNYIWYTQCYDTFYDCKDQKLSHLPFCCDLPRQFHNIIVVGAVQTAGRYRSSQEAAPAPAQTFDLVSSL